MNNIILNVFGSFWDSIIKLSYTEKIIALCLFVFAIIVIGFITIDSFTTVFSNKTNEEPKEEPSKEKEVIKTKEPEIKETSRPSHLNEMESSYEEIMIDLPEGTIVRNKPFARHLRYDTPIKSIEFRPLTKKNLTTFVGIRGIKINGYDLVHHDIDRLGTLASDECGHVSESSLDSNTEIRLYKSSYYNGAYRVKTSSGNSGYLILNFKKGEVTGLDFELEFTSMSEHLSDVEIRVTKY